MPVTWRLLVGALGTGCLLGVGALHQGLSLARVTSNSMAPFVTRGDWVLIAGSKGLPRRGEIVVFQYPLGTTGRAIKRVWGLPGDSLVITRDSIALNGTMTPLAGGLGPADAEPRHVEVPADSVYLIGDNAAASLDSRNLGPIPLNMISGRVLLGLHLPHL